MMNQIGPNIRRIREEQGITQESMARHCQQVGWNLSRGTLAKMEAQVRRITDIEVLLLAKALKIEVAALFQFIDATESH